MTSPTAPSFHRPSVLGPSKASSPASPTASPASPAASAASRISRAVSGLPSAGARPSSALTSGGSKYSLAGGALGKSSLTGGLSRGTRTERSSGGSRPLMFRSSSALGSTYFLEKQAIVIDFGRAHTKVGFATESRPRHFIATPELRVRRRLGPELSCTASVGQWTDILVKLLSKIFFHYLSVSPKDRRVVICDAAHSTAAFREATASVLMKRFSVPSIAWVTDLVLPLYLTGLSSGIVIDIGYTSTRILATLHGVPILSAYGATACAGRLMNTRLQRSLKQNLAGEEAAWLQDEEVIEDIKVRTCYVSCNLPIGTDGQEVLRLETDKSVEFPLSQQDVVKIPPEIRCQPTEVLFAVEDEADTQSKVDDACCEWTAPFRGGDGPGSNLPIQELFSQVLDKCPIDARLVVLQNVVVCGGGAQLRGLLPRLAVEVRDQLLKNHTTKLVEHLRFTPLDFAPVCAVWTGGAVFGSLDGQNDYTAEMHEQGDRIPDWCRDGFA